MPEGVDCIVVGGGVVGLACGRQLAMDGHEVLVLERHAQFGTETSARNSEVIHAGIYYPAEFLKTSLCVRGRELLYRYCAERGIAHRQTGKLILAADQGQQQQLQHYRQQARQNGVGDLHLLSASELSALEPRLAAVAALYSPSSGIIDSHAYMQALLGDLQQHRGQLVCRSHVAAIDPLDEGFLLQLGGETDFAIQCCYLVNAAGLCAWDVTSSIRSPNPLALPPRYYAKGHYYRLRGAAPCSHLVYPLPEAGGLGVHLTLDLAGQARFGPDVRWVDELDYSFDDEQRQAFAQSIRSYYPAITAEDLQPAYTGIRPKLSGPGEPAADFLLEDAKQHGIRGLVNLYGIESPGLTASLALAEAVATLIVA